MNYTVKPTLKFQKDLKKAEKRGYDISLLTRIIKFLQMEKNYLQNTKTIV